MSDTTFAVGTLLLCGAITVLATVGVFITSPVMAIFAITFLLATLAAAAELRHHL